MVVLIRTVLAVADISRPGLDPDETLFVNAATLRLPGIFIAHTFHGIPLMVFPYIGALKSWLYDPIFAVFGTSATSIRVPVVLIVSASLLLLYVAVRDLVNIPVALLSVTALCFDGSVFWLTRDDVGPSALEFALKCVALFSAARFARSPKARWVLALLVSLGLGVFNKLNFIWVVNAATAVSVLVAIRHRRSLRARWPVVAVWVAGLAVIYLCWALYYFHNHIDAIEATGGSSLAQPWPDFEPRMSSILAGTWFYTYALAKLATPDPVVWLILVLFAAGAVASVASPRTRNRPIAWMALGTLLIAIQILITLKATAGWHYISVYPFVTIVAVYGVYAAAQLLVRRSDRVRLALACVAAVILAYDGFLMAKYFSALQRAPKYSAWSPAIYTLSNDLRNLNAHVFTADWGIFPQLYAQHPGRQVTELAYGVGGPYSATEAKAIRAIVAGVPGPKVIVTHTNPEVIFPNANKHLFKALAGHLKLAQTVTGPQGVPVYNIYSYH